MQWLTKNKAWRLVSIHKRTVPWPTQRNCRHLFENRCTQLNFLPCLRRTVQQYPLHIARTRCLYLPPRLLGVSSYTRVLHHDQTIEAKKDRLQQPKKKQLEKYSLVQRSINLVNGIIFDITCNVRAKALQLGLKTKKINNYQHINNLSQFFNYKQPNQRNVQYISYKLKRKS